MNKNSYIEIYFAPEARENIRGIFFFVLFYFVLFFH